jgi:FtsH-binding integral membrane protein
MTMIQQDVSIRGYGSSSKSYVDERASFIVKTYNHLFGAIALFALSEYVLFSTGLAPAIALTMSRSWLLVLGGFMVVGWLASHTAHSARSLGAQYAALAGYVVAEAIVFVPLLYVADRVAPGAIKSAAVVSLLGFAGLTAVAFTTKKDFSFLGGFLRWGGILALVAIAAGVIFGFNLGTFFSVIMVGFAGAAILYDTSAVLRDFPTNRYVAASLQLFSSVALLFWYILQIFMGSSRD